MTTEDLLYYVNLVDKAVAGFKRIDSNLQRSSMGKNAIKQCTTEKSFMRGRVN